MVLGAWLVASAARTESPPDVDRPPFDRVVDDLRHGQRAAARQRLDTIARGLRATEPSRAAFAWRWAGQLALADGKPAEALDPLTRASDPSLPESDETRMAHVLLSEALQQLGRTDDARRALQPRDARTRDAAIHAYAQAQEAEIARAERSRRLRRFGIPAGLVAAGLIAVSVVPALRRVRWRPLVLRWSLLLAGVLLGAELVRRFGPPFAVTSWLAGTAPAAFLLAAVTDPAVSRGAWRRGLVLVALTAACAALAVALAWDAGLGVHD